MSSLETSVTLDDVFAVAIAKRVPLAPELAGYLTLEIADGARATDDGEIDPRTVYISEEGTVALVRPKKEAQAAGKEASLRSILAKLLEASGSATPALSATARKPSGEGLPALITELEAALIPVNRAAGRRALARLARTVKRVTLGVGRNASMPSIRGSSPSFTDEAATAKRDTSALAAETNAAPESTSSLRGPASSSIGQASHQGAGPASVRRGTLARGPEVRKREPAKVEAPDPEPRENETKPRAPSRLFGGDEVETLLDSFSVSSLGDGKQMARDLKAIAGLDPTPPPPSAAALDALIKDIGKDTSADQAKPKNEAMDVDGIEALLALADRSEPIAAPPPSSTAIPKIAPAEESVPVSTSPRTTRSDLSSKGRREYPSRSALLDPPRKSRLPKVALAMLGLVVVAIGALAAAVWLWRPELLSGSSKRVVPTPSSSTPSTAVASSVGAASTCKAALVVRDAPANAEILLRVGQAPLDVERMPMGARLEFVATADGYAPRRAVVKADATWDQSADGKPRIDVPIQLDPSKAKPGAVDPWPAAEAGSEVGGAGKPGTVHVVSNVRGAEIWLLAGLGPEARVGELRCDSDIDLLVAGPQSLRRHLHVSDDEIAAAPLDAKGHRAVTISAK